MIVAGRSSAQAGRQTGWSASPQRCRKFECKALHTIVDDRIGRTGHQSAETFDTGASEYLVPAPASRPAPAPAAMVKPGFVPVVALPTAIRDDDVGIGLRGERSLSIKSELELGFLQED